MRSHRFALLGIFLLLVAAKTNFAAQIQEVTTVEGITEYSMDNGMQILLFPDETKPTITVNITYRVGSRHEGRGEAGMAHLLEHMVFKGTPTYPNIWGALEDHGARFNGTTWVDRTNYYETLPASDENLEFAIRMEADRMVNSLIAEEELAKEMTVVRNEFEMGENSPSGVLSERLFSAAYLWHNYGKSTIGNRSDIERVPASSLRVFYERYYQPDNATLLVAGRFDRDRVLELIAKYFGEIPRPERVLDATYTEEPAQDGARMVTLKRVGDVAVAGLVYHIPAGFHPDFPAVQLLSDILTDQPSGHLYRKLVIPSLATSVSGTAFAFAEPGLMQLSAQVAGDQNPEAVLDYMIDTAEGLAERGVTEEEVERAKKSRMKWLKMSMNDSGRVGVRLSESIAQGDWRLFFIHRDRIAAVTAEDVQRVATEYLVEPNRTAGLFIPTEEATRVAISAAPPVEDIVEGYEGQTAVEQGEALSSDLHAMEQRVTRHSLAPGINIALLPTKARGSAVYATFRLRYGDEATLNGHTTAANLIPSLLMRGTQNRDYQQLRDDIDALESTISFGRGRSPHGGGGAGGSPGVAGGSIVSDRAHVVSTIELLAEILREPAFDEEEFRIVVSRRRSMLEQGLSDPMMKGSVAMSQQMSPWAKDSIHYVPTLEERLERLDAVTLDEVRQLYEDHFGASHFDIAFVGDFDPDEVITALEKTLGDWNSPGAYQRITEPYLAAKAGRTVINTPDKEMAMVSMGTTFELSDSDPHYPALTLAGYVLGSSSKSRLLNRLRHEGGLSYTAFARISADRFEARGALQGLAICAPQNAGKALEGMEEEIVSWISDGITEEELEEAKQSYLLKFESRNSGEQFLAGELARGLEMDRTLEFRANLQEQIAALTLDDIKAALQAVLSEAEMAQLVAGDVDEEF